MPDTTTRVDENVHFKLVFLRSEDGVFIYAVTMPMGPTIPDVTIFEGTCKQCCDFIVKVDSCDFG